MHKNAHTREGDMGKPTRRLDKKEIMQKKCKTGNMFEVNKELVFCLNTNKSFV